MKKIIALIALTSVMGFTQENQTPVSVVGHSSDSGPTVMSMIPRATDRYSWAKPMADLLSYAKQAIRHVSGSVHPTTVLPLSRQQHFSFEFKSPRADGVVMASDLNAAIAKRKFDVVIAQSEVGFWGYVHLSDVHGMPLFNGGFWVDLSESTEQKVRIQYYLNDEIYIPVPTDLESVKITMMDPENRQMTEWVRPEDGMLRVRTDQGPGVHMQASFADGQVINFNLAHGGLAESEKRATVEVFGDFPNTYTFPKGSNIIALGLEEWMLNRDGEYTAVFEPSAANIALYAEASGKSAKAVRLRRLPGGVTTGRIPLTPGKALNFTLPDGSLGVWEATFTFEQRNWLNGPGLIRG